MRKIRPDISVGPGKIRLFFFAGVAGAAVYGFAAVGAMAGTDELNAGAVTAIAAGFTAFLAVMYGIFVYIILRTLAGVIAGVTPFIHCIEAGAVVAAATGTTFQRQVHDIRMGFRAITVMTVCAATVGGITAMGDIVLGIIVICAAGVILSILRRRLGRRIRFGRLCVIFFCAGLLRC